MILTCLRYAVLLFVNVLEHNKNGNGYQFLLKNYPLTHRACVQILCYRQSRITAQSITAEVLIKWEKAERLGNVVIVKHNSVRRRFRRCRGKEGIT